MKNSIHIRHAFLGLLISLMSLSGLAQSKNEVTTKGRVIIKDDSIPLADIRIGVFAADSSFLAETRTDRKGRFVLNYPHEEGKSVIFAAEGQWKTAVWESIYYPELIEEMVIEVEAHVKLDAVVIYSPELSNADWSTIRRGPICGDPFAMKSRSVIVCPIFSLQWLNWNSSANYRNINDGLFMNRSDVYMKEH